MSASTPPAAQREISPNRLNEQTDRLQPAHELEIRLPPRRDLGVHNEPDQDQEWCEIRVDGAWRRIRFHDYNEIYEIPGLYEALFERQLQCDSPRRVVELLTDVVRSRGESVADLRVLDLGAGNGMVGERLAAEGAGPILGLDIIEEARGAAERDRPGVYAEYVVADMTHPTEAQHAALERFKPNCLTTVAALGFGDVPQAAFANSWNAVRDGGWVAFNLKAQFMQHPDESEFGQLIWQMLEANTLEMHASRRYAHRLSIGGMPIDYMTFVGRKNGPVRPN
jgi:SAM-dependent methyltransferase